MNLQVVFCRKKTSCCNASCPFSSGKTSVLGGPCNLPCSGRLPVQLGPGVQTSCAHGPYSYDMTRNFCFVVVYLCVSMTNLFSEKTAVGLQFLSGRVTYGGSLYLRRLLAPSGGGSAASAAARRALRNSSCNSSGKRRRATSTVYSGNWAKSCRKRFFPLSFSRTCFKSSGSQNEQRCCPGFGCAGLPVFENMQASPVFTCPWQRRGMVRRCSTGGFEPTAAAARCNCCRARFNTHKRCPKQTIQETNKLLQFLTWRPDCPRQKMS